MKKIITLLSLVAVCGLTLKAQEKSANFRKPNYGKHELNLSVSDGIFHQLVGSLTMIPETVISGISNDDLKREDSNTTPVFSANYKYQLKDKLALGGGISYFQTGTKFINKETEVTVLKKKKSFIQLMPTIDYSYYRSNLVNLYGNAGIGVMFGISQTNSNTPKVENESSVRFASLALQVNPIGVSVGKKFGGFAEIGYGTVGLIKGGLFYKF